MIFHRLLKSFAVDYIHITISSTHCSL